MLKNVSRPLWGFVAVTMSCLGNAVLIMDQIGANPSHMSQNVEVSMDAPSGLYAGIDDFVPSTTLTMDWIEAHVRVSNYGSGPTWANTAYWRVDLYADNSGAPGVLIASMLVTGNLVGVTQNYGFSSAAFPSNALVHIPLPGGFVVLAGVRYWISVSPHEPATRIFGVSHSNFTGGFPMNGACWNMVPPSNLTNVSVDLAYRINGF